MVENMMNRRQQQADFNVSKAKRKANEQRMKNNQKKIMAAQIRQGSYRFPIEKLLEMKETQGEAKTVKTMKQMAKDLPNGWLSKSIDKSAKALSKGLPEWTSSIIYSNIRNTDLKDKMFEQVGFPNVNNVKGVASAVAVKSPDFFIQIRDKVDGAAPMADNDVVSSYGDVPSWVFPQTQVIDKQFVEQLSPQSQEILFSLDPQQTREVVLQAKEKAMAQGITPEQAMQEIGNEISGQLNKANGLMTDEAKIATTPNNEMGKAIVSAKNSMSLGGNEMRKSANLMGNPQMDIPMPRGSQAILPVPPLERNIGGEIPVYTMGGQIPAYGWGGDILGAITSSIFEDEASKKRKAELEEFAKRLEQEKEPQYRSVIKQPQVPPMDEMSRNAPPAGISSYDTFNPELQHVSNRLALETNTGGTFGPNVEAIGKDLVDQAALAPPAMSDEGVIENSSQYQQTKKQDVAEKLNWAAAADERMKQRMMGSQTVPNPNALDRRIPQIPNVGQTHTMPDGTVMAGAEHIDTGANQAREGANNVNTALRNARLKEGVDATPPGYGSAAQSVGQETMMNDEGEIVKAPANQNAGLVGSGRGSGNAELNMLSKRQELNDKARLLEQRLAVMPSDSQGRAETQTQLDRVKGELGSMGGTVNTGLPDLNQTGVNAGLLGAEDQLATAETSLANAKTMDEITTSLEAIKTANQAVKDNQLISEKESQLSIENKATISNTKSVIENIDAAMEATTDPELKAALIKKKNGAMDTLKGAEAALTFENKGKPFVDKETLSEIKTATETDPIDLANKTDNILRKTPRDVRKEIVKNATPLVTLANGDTIKQINGGWVVVKPDGTYKGANPAQAKTGKLALDNKALGAAAVVNYDVAKSSFIDGVISQNPDTTQEQAEKLWDQKIADDAAKTLNANGLTGQAADNHIKDTKLTAAQIKANSTGNKEFDKIAVNAVNSSNTVNGMLSALDSRIQGLKKDHTAAWKKQMITGLIGYGLVMATGGNFAQAIQAAELGMKVGGGDLAFVNKQLELYQGAYGDALTNKMKALIKREFPNEADKSGTYTNQIKNIKFAEQQLALYKLTNGAQGMSPEEYETFRKSVINEEATAIGITAGKEQVKSDQKAVDLDNTKWVEAQTQLQQLDRLESALKEYGSGPITGNKYVILAKQIVAEIAPGSGLADSVANAEEAKNVVASLLVSKRGELKGQGTITDGENAMLRDTLPSLTGTPKANEIIIAASRNWNKRQTKMIDEWYSMTDAERKKDAPRGYVDWRNKYIRERREGWLKETRGIIDGIKAKAGDGSVTGTTPGGINYTLGG